MGNAMLPPEFIERIKSQTYIDAVTLVGAFEAPAVTSIRINSLKWSVPVDRYQPVEWESDGRYLPGRPLFTTDPLFHAGVYYPQESSSMFTGEVFRQLTAGRSGLRVLDLCGAPGGKSTHLAGLIGDDGLLVANEVIRSRASVLAENITKWGTGNVIVTNADPSRFAMLPGFFDVIVADVPCSGEGMFRTAVAVREWSLQNTRLCSERQRRIVMEAWPALRPGGLLIYSTCTFNPAENEENISWLIEQLGAESLAVDLPEGSPVVPVRWGRAEGYGFHPGRVKGDGFFIAAIRKSPGTRSDHGGNDAELRMNADRGLNSCRGPVMRKGKGGSSGSSSMAFERTEPVALFDRERMVMHDERIIALAADRGLFSYLAERLPIIKAGTMIGEMKKDVLIPAHDLAMSVKLREEAWPRHQLGGEEALAYLRLEAPSATGMPHGRVLLTYKGAALGFANNLGSRVNNGFPRAWRIRMERGNPVTEIL
jgi:16S rRNA C967 or C1407 C5-methylase (RsmB/RsmF family)/NOL1/NOP2/fmu family ribosome biogenesis protein